VAEVGAAATAAEALARTGAAAATGREAIVVQVAQGPIAQVVGENATLNA